MKMLNFYKLLVIIYTGIGLCLVNTVFALLVADTAWVSAGISLLTLAVGAVAVLFVRRLRTLFSNASLVLGQAIKGDLTQRMEPGAALDDLDIMQHRINNLIDVVDVFVRGNGALIAQESDSGYFKKISQAPLMGMLKAQAGGILDMQDKIETAPIKPTKKIADAAGNRAFLSGIKQSLSELSDLSQRLQASVSTIVSNCESGSSGTTNSREGVIEAAQRTQHNVETVAAAAEELTYSINEISERVGESSRIAEQAVEHAKKSNVIVTGLNAASEKIGDVVNLITDIAGQTNLLALNATIEAARAGEAGRGFAVVASEVKNLADQTAKATEDISGQIGSIQDSTNSAVKAIQEIGDTINKISEISTAIALAVEEQSAATSEISRNIQEAANGTQEVTSTINSLASGNSNNVAAITSSHDALQLANLLTEGLAVMGGDVQKQNSKNDAVDNQAA